MTNRDVETLIRARRLQVWAHSIIYYEMNDNIVSDDQWSRWACELEDLQIKYPDVSAKVRHYDVFKDFDHSTGHNLPLDDPVMYSRAWHLLRIYRKWKMENKIG